MIAINNLTFSVSLIIHTFCFLSPNQRDYWLGPKLIKVDVIEDHELVAEKSIGDGDFFEAEPKDLKPGVKIRQLRKVTIVKFLVYE